MESSKSKPFISTTKNQNKVSLYENSSNNSKGLDINKLRRKYETQS